MITLCMIAVVVALFGHSTDFVINFCEALKDD